VCACLGVAVDGGAEAGLLEAGVALDPPELRLLRHAAPARRHAFFFSRNTKLPLNQRLQGDPQRPNWLQIRGLATFAA